LSANRSLEQFLDEKISSQTMSFWQGFENKFLPCIQEATETFWEEDFDIRLFNICEYEKTKDNPVLKGEVFFTSQVPSLSTPPVTIRLSSEFARLILHNVFGSSSAQFKLNDLSELEIKILNAYCDFLSKSFAKVLLAPEELEKAELKNKAVSNFTLLVKNKDEKISKIVITLPNSRLKFKNFKTQENFSDQDFIDLSTLTDIIVGSSRVTLNDLKCISSGDIILLENSNVSKMKIKCANEIKEFKLNPDPSLIIELDEDEHDIDNMEGEQTTMWDDIQIEVNAQFQKVKMTLGDLKHISKGLVIDLGSIFNNEISLLVEDKVVAKGELVIINDKYAVKVSDIVSDKEVQKEPVSVPKQEVAPQPQVNAKAQPQQKPQPQVQAQKARAVADDVEEDFDYSNFEEEK